MGDLTSIFQFPPKGWQRGRSINAGKRAQVVWKVFFLQQNHTLSRQRKGEPAPFSIFSHFNCFLSLLKIKLRLIVVRQLALEPVNLLRPIHLLLVFNGNQVSLSDLHSPLPKLYLRWWGWWDNGIRYTIKHVSETIAAREQLSKEEELILGLCDKIDWEPLLGTHQLCCVVDLHSLPDGMRKHF